MVSRCTCHINPFNCQAHARAEQSVGRVVFRDRFTPIVEPVHGDKPFPSDEVRLKIRTEQVLDCPLHGAAPQGMTQEQFFFWLQGAVFINPNPTPEQSHDFFLAVRDALKGLK